MPNETENAQNAGTHLIIKTINEREINIYLEFGQPIIYILPWNVKFGESEAD